MKLEINGTSYNLNFGLGAFEIAGDRLEMSADEVLEKIFEPKVFNHLVYASIENAIKLEDEYALTPFSYNVFINKIGEMPQDVNKEILEAFLNTTRFGKTFREHFGIDIPEEAENKKKGTKKKAQEK